MKELLAVISLLVSGAVAEPPAPYPPSGWRPNGPAFPLPQRGQDQQPSQYLPPVYTLDPRTPSPAVEYGPPEDDVSVQGLPVQEESPFYQRSPVNGQQNVGRAFQSDIKNLDQGLKQTQFQQQQQNYREFDRQRQLDAQINRNRQQRPINPVQIVPTTTAATEPSTTETTTQVSTTEITLNEGETLKSSEMDKKVSVEVARQKIQEYPGEFFLSSLAQIQLQPQFVPLQQFGQIKSGYYQPAQSQKQAASFDAQTHFAALPLILAQQQFQKQRDEQGFQNPGLLITGQPQARVQPVAYQPQPQYQAEPVAVQPAQAVQPQVFYGQSSVEPQYQTVNAFPQSQQPLPQFPAQSVVLQPQGVNQIQPNQYQPQSQQVDQFQPQTVQNQPQPAQYQPPVVQYQPQPAQFQPQQGQFQLTQFQPKPQQVDQFQPQTVQNKPQIVQYQPPVVQYQPQPAQFQPQQGQFQPQPDQDNQDVEYNVNSSYQPQIYQQPMLVQQPINQYQGPLQPQSGYIQAQLINFPGQDLSQFQQQNQYQPQSPDALQSGLDVNQGNDLEEPQDQEEMGQDEGRTATAVATAFGARTQPRVFSQYGAPFPVPKVQAAPGTSTETPVEDTTDEGPVVAQAVAIADGNRKKSARLRSRRVRPIFTLDRSGHLVLAQGQ